MAQRGNALFWRPSCGFQLDAETARLCCSYGANPLGAADVFVFENSTCIPFRYLLLAPLKLIITLNFNGAERSNLSMPSTSTSHEFRCLCGNLLARLRSDGVELKCRRCKRIVVIPWEASLSPGAIMDATLAHSGKKEAGYTLRDGNRRGSLDTVHTG